MPEKKVSVTVRMAQEDVDFISRLVIGEATTPSEKIRALISSARFQEERPNDYGDLLKEFERLVLPAIDEIKIFEHDAGRHSELIALFAEWLPEAVAEFLTVSKSIERDLRGHKKLEMIVADRIARLFERILRILVVPGEAIYEPQAVVERLQTSLELAEVVKKMMKGKENG